MGISSSSSRLAPFVQQANIAEAQVTSGTVELTLATLTVSAQTAGYTLECSSFFSALNSVANDAFEGRIKVNGATVASVVVRHPSGANERCNYAMPTSLLVAIAANATATVTVTVLRTIGTGTLTTDDNLTGQQWVTARGYF